MFKKIKFIFLIILFSLISVSADLKCSYTHGIPNPKPDAKGLPESSRILREGNFSSEILLNASSGYPMLGLANSVKGIFHRLEFDGNKFISTLEDPEVATSFYKSYIFKLDPKGNAHILTNRNSDGTRNRSYSYVFWNGKEFKKIADLYIATKIRKIWMKIDKLNRAHFFYLDEGARRIFYVSSISDWKTILVAWGINDFYWLDIAFDSNNNPHVVGRIEFKDDEIIFYAYLDDKDFIIEQVSGRYEDEDYTEAKLILDNNDIAHLILKRAKKGISLYVRVFLPPLSTHVWLASSELSPIALIYNLVSIIDGQSLSRWNLAYIFFQNSEHVSITFDNKNVPHVLQCRKIQGSDDNRILYLTRVQYPKPEHFQETLIERSNCSGRYDIVVDKDGTVFAMISTDNNVRIYQKKKDDSFFTKKNFGISNPQIFMDSSSNVGITYSDYSGFHVAYYDPKEADETWTDLNTPWKRQTIDPEVPNALTSPQFYQTDKGLNIIYDKKDGDNARVKLAIQNESTWRTKEITLNGYLNSIAIDQEEKRHIASYNKEKQELVYTVFDNRGQVVKEPMIISSSISIEEPCHIAIFTDRDNNAFIVYFDKENKALKCVRAEETPVEKYSLEAKLPAKISMFFLGNDISYLCFLDGKELKLFMISKEGELKSLTKKFSKNVTDLSFSFNRLGHLRVGYVWDWYFSYARLDNKFNEDSWKQPELKHRDAFTGMATGCYGDRIFNSDIFLFNETAMFLFNTDDGLLFYRPEEEPGNICFIGTTTLTK